MSWMPVLPGATSPMVYCFDAYDPSGLAAAVASFGDRRFGYLVTPNTDHVIRLCEDPMLRQAYAEASFVALDSRVIAIALRLLRGLSLPVCTGSDLTLQLLNQVIAPQDEIVLIGGSELQAQQLRERYGLRRLHHHNPPMGFIRDEAAVEECLRFVEAHSPFRFCLLAVGCPQQEVLAYELHRRGRAKGLALCIGASIDFLTGRQRRAPRWMQRAGLEWLHRLLHDPRRLAHRYLVRGPRLLPLLRRAQFALRQPAALSTPAAT